MTHGRLKLAAAVIGLSGLTFAPGNAAAAAAADQQEQRQQQASAEIQKWPEVCQKAYQEMKAKYGEPSGVTPTRMVWTTQGPFAEIILLADAYPHNFPKKHMDCLEHVVIYKVPEEKVGELAKFDGSVIVDRTRGVISARCDSEPHNLMALNLAHDIITGKKTVDEARKAYGEAVMAQMQGKTPEIAVKLQFQPQQLAEAGDPDVSTLGANAQAPAQPGEAQPAAARQRGDDKPDQPKQPAQSHQPAGKQSGKQ